MMRGMRPPRHVPLLLALFCALAGLAPDAHAYLDPSTGSMILSAIVGLFATIGLAIKTFWYRLKNLLTRRGPAASPPGPGRTSTGQTTGDNPRAGGPGQANRSP
jgi:uncharacterized iron-regulated membrane protein